MYKRVHISWKLGLRKFHQGSLERRNEFHCQQRGQRYNLECKSFQGVWKTVQENLGIQGHTVLQFNLRTHFHTQKWSHIFQYGYFQSSWDPWDKLSHNSLSKDLQRFHQDMFTGTNMSSHQRRLQDWHLDNQFYKLYCGHNSQQYKLQYIALFGYLHTL